VIPKIDLFGLPHFNVQYVTALRGQMEAEGHNVLLIEQDARHVHLMLERTVLKKEIDRQKRGKVNMTSQSKMTFLEKWRKSNAMMLMSGGLAVPAEGEEESEFFTGIIFSPKYATDAVPELQQCVQVDACHMQFGKYTLYSAYGITTNCNTFPIVPIAFGILFGNKCKEGWTEFFSVVEEWHPTLNVFQTTFISD
jgi:hypothetical protein